MNDNWQPRLAPGQKCPETLEEYYENALSPVYADSGIQGHLEYLKTLVKAGDVVVELGMGGGDQSTLAWLAGKPIALISHDVNEPGSLETINRLAHEKGIRHMFIQGDTATCPTFPCDILLIDTLHDADTVEMELRRFADEIARLIVFHDVVAFGRHGQFAGADQGINLAIAEFLFEHPEWRVERYVKHDNGLLTLRKEEP